MVRIEPTHILVPGPARGRLLQCRHSLSLWGGVDVATGVIIDQRHDRRGDCITDRILALPSEKGSSTGSAILLELIRRRLAPAAILTIHRAPILTLGVIVADELYGRTLPILTISEHDFHTLEDNSMLHVMKRGVKWELLLETQN